jgi:hypothetical protein
LFERSDFRRNSENLPPVVSEVAPQWRCRMRRRGGADRADREPDSKDEAAGRRAPAPTEDGCDLLPRLAAR